MEFGLKQIDKEYILDNLRKFDAIEKAVILGSRANGNYKPESDIDIVIMGDKVNFNVLSRLHSLMEDEGAMPYFIDVVDYTHLNHEDLKSHIDRVGKVIYEKSR